MFIIIPAIIIFLAFSYLYVNDNVSIFMQISIYMFIFIVLFITLYLYKAIQKNLKQQEKNKILLEINQLASKLKNTKNEEERIILQKKIVKLENEAKNHNL